MFCCLGCQQCSHPALTMGLKKSHTMWEVTRPWEQKLFEKWPQIFSVWIAYYAFTVLYLFTQIQFLNALSLFYMKKYDQCSLQGSIWICWLPSWTSCEGGYARFSILKCQFLCGTWEILNACCLNIPYPYKGKQLRSGNILRAAMCLRIGDFCL